MAWLGSFFGGAGGNSGGSEFVGQYVDLGKQKLRIKKVLAEGGYGYVFVAQDVTTSKEYALKRLMAADDATSKLIVKEVTFLRKLRGHPNIVQYIAAASGEENKDHSIKEYLILTELCTGQLVELMKSQVGKSLPFEQVLKIFAQLCRAVSHMHKQTPPIIHRDLKIENMLISMKGVIKICDFGSATTDALYPDSSWNALQRSMAEDEIQRNTTPMYRAPEMVDLYSDYAITTKADMWAVGCVLYMLCFMQHPFEDSAKLKIMNANYTIPETDKTFHDFHHLIHSMLKVNPEERSTIDDIYAELVSISADRSIDLKAPIIETPNSATTEAGEQVPGGGANYGSSVILGSVYNKAGALFSNIKDVSSKVMHTVAGYARSDMDISYVTSRLLVMSFPADGIEGTYKNNIEDVRVFLDSKHTDAYVVINTSQRNYRTAKLNDRVYDSGWNPKRSPSLEKLVSLCRKLNNFLKQNKKNVVVVHCLDGKVASSLLVCSFFLFCKLFTKVSMAIHLFNLKRCTTEEPVVLSPSQKRYINYVGQLVSSSKYIPHNNIVFLKSFSVSPIPIFNKARTGCRPFVEIYEDDKRIFSTAQEIDQMREYAIDDGKIVFQTHIRLHGDITIYLHHGRSTLGGKVQGKLTSINIFTLQFHTGFLSKDSPHVMFSMNQLDIPEQNSDRYPINFGVCLSVKFSDETPDKISTMPWEKMHVDKLSPYVCFETREEYWLLHEEYGLSEENDPTGKSECITDSTEMEGFPPSIDVGETTENALFDLETDEPEKKTEEPSLLISNIYNEDNQHIKQTEPPPSLFDAMHNETKPIALQSAPRNTDNSVSLIDISPSPSHISTNIQTDEFSAFSEPYQSNHIHSNNIPHIELEDPIDLFASLATSRTSNTGNLLDEVSDGPFLLNLDQSSNAAMQRSTSFPTGFDLLNSVNESAASVKPTNPDILPRDFVPLKRNKSLDNVNCDDVFGKLVIDTSHDDSYSEKSSKYMDPFMKHFHNSPRKSISESNLLGELADDITTEMLKPEVQHASSTAELNKTTTYDPFSEFGNIQHPKTFGLKDFRKPAPVAMQNNTTRVSPTPISQAKPQTTANYNVFIAPLESGAFSGKSSQKTGWAPKQVNMDEFSDILGAQGFKKTSFSDPQKSSLKQLRNLQDDDGNEDPVRRKVREWSDGKGRNIRALLTSLTTVLWESEDKWQPIGIHQIMQATEVKRFYKRAAVAVHPDKHVDQPHESLARAIFIELNESWTLFQDSGSQSLM